MRKLFSTVAALILAANLWAGVPQGFSFQAVVRNAQGELVQNSSNVSVKVSIMKDAADDANIVYAETNTAATNANGLMSLQIGEGDAISGSFDKIDWSNGIFFIKTEIDIEGGDNYSISSVQQLLSVPFAMYAGKAENVPTKVSDLDNDAKYVSETTLNNYVKNVENLSSVVKNYNFALADTLALYVKNGSKLSSFENDAKFVSQDSLAAYAKSNQKISTFENDANYVSADTLNIYARSGQKISTFENDANYVSADTLDNYAKSNQKVSLFENDADYVTSSTLNNYAKKSDIPEEVNLSSYLRNGSNISRLNNDAKYISVDTLNSYAKTDQNISSFNNDANYVTSSTLKSYAKSNQNISSFNNDAKYISEDTLSAYALKSELPDGVDLSTYLHNGSNISKLNNDAKYISQSEVDEKLASLNSQLAGEGMVDLGLPSGTLWATCNVGAAEPYEAGDLIAWGETAPKEKYNKTTYTYEWNADSTAYLRYGDDGITTLKPEDDAATANMGERWSMPTQEQWNELLNYCYREKVTEYNNIQVNGYIFYKAKDKNDKGKGSNPTASYSVNDAHIFLPISGSYVEYWSSTLYTTNTTGAYVLRIPPLLTRAESRIRGCNVRAVTTPSVMNAQNAVNATNAVTANKATQYIGDMPLVNVTVNVVDEYGVATASFLGQDIKNGSQTFVVPAYSPVFLSVALSKYTQAAGTNYTPYEYTYSVKINDEYFDNTGFEYDRANEKVYNSLETYSLNNYFNGSYLLSINSYKEEEVLKYKNNPYVKDKDNHKNKDEFYLPIVDNMYDYNCDGTDSNLGDNRYDNNEQMENPLSIGVSDNDDLFPIYNGHEGLNLGGVRIDKKQNNETLMGISHIKSSVRSHYDIYAHMPNWIYRNSYTTLKTYKVGRGYEVNKYNNEYLNADMKNQTVGPFPNAENTITITIMRAGGEHIVN